MLRPDINLNGIRAYTEERIYSKSDKSFAYSGIWLFTGSQGSGKTLLLMETLKKMHEEYPEALIVSNISVFGIPCIPYTGISDFGKYKNGEKGVIFVIDEIHTLFSSLESAQMPVSTLTVWSQNRKNRRVILGTSQRFTRVAKGIREQTTYNYECRKGFLCFHAYRIREGDDYDENGKYIGEDERYNYYVPRVSTMRMYNTLEVVNANKEVKND